MIWGNPAFLEKAGFPQTPSRKNMYLVAQASGLRQKSRVGTAHHLHSLRKQTTGSCANTAHPVWWDGLSGLCFFTGRIMAAVGRATAS